MRKSISVIFMMLMLAFGSTACWDPVGDAEGDARAEQEAKTISKLVSKTVLNMTEELGALMVPEEGQEGARKLAKTIANELTFDGGMFSGTVENSKGGSVDIEGSGSYDATNGNIAFEATLVFKEFVAGSITFDGTLDVTFSGTLEDGSLLISGDLSVTGDIETEAEVDLTITITAGSATATGHINGEEVNESL